MSAVAAVSGPRVEEVMGMPIVVEARSGDLDPAVLEEVFDWFRRVDAAFSTYRPDSEISRLVRGELEPARCSADVRHVLEQCEELRLETRGYFDARAGGSLDPSGFVKGWAVDRAAAILDDAGCAEFVVSAGGDLLARGGPWRIGIENPRDRSTLAAVVEARDLAVATSGAYIRGDHVLNPYTRRPPRGVLSVTVVGPELARADAYATAAFAMGAEAAPGWLANLPQHEALVILEDDVVLSTGGFPHV